MAEETAGQGLEMTEVQRQSYLRALRERVGIDTSADPDPLIDLAEIAAFAGVSVNTPTQWRQRYKGGSDPFPAPENTRHADDKPLWRAVTRIGPWLDRTHRWPPGTAVRGRRPAA